MSKILFQNGCIICKDSLVDSGYIYVEFGKIKAMGSGSFDVSPDVQKIDVKGKYLSPGFIDLHVHGAGGHDFMDASPEAFVAIAETHAQYGTTAMCPTSLTAAGDSIYAVLDAYAKALPLNTNGSKFLGMHLEGPYLSMNQRGAQDAKYIRNPDPTEYKAILDYSPYIKRWSAAPELPGALEFADFLMEKNIIPALAHSDAIYEEVLQGFAHGYKLATHFYSAMSGITRKNAKRYAGCIEAGYLLDDMDVEIIADGVHVPKELMQLIYKIKGADRIALVTDAMRAAAMPEGESVLGRLSDGMKVIVEDGVAKLPDRTAFAGSVATSDQLLRNYVQLAEVPLIEVIRMMSHTPARILSLEQRKGSLAIDMDADILILNKELFVELTMIEGKICYQKN